MRTRTKAPPNPPSISRWAKDNRELLQSVVLRVEEPDQDWRRTPAYHHWRQAVLTRDAHRCQRCGARATTVHHRIPAHICKDLRYHPDNGVALCRPCHANEPHQFDPAFWEKMIHGY